jgi:hypothetical protein
MTGARRRAREARTRYYCGSFRYHTAPPIWWWCGVLELEYRYLNSRAGPRHLAEPRGKRGGEGWRDLHGDPGGRCAPAKVLDTTYSSTYTHPPPTTRLLGKKRIVGSRSLYVPTRPRLQTKNKWSAFSNGSSRVPTGCAKRAGRIKQHFAAGRRVGCGARALSVWRSSLRFWMDE